MGVLQRFERRVEQLVNGAFARAFKSEVQPVEVAAALQRECDDKVAIVGRDRRMVPNDFTVELGPHDFERLAQYDAELTAELADMVREHAAEQGYSLVGPVGVHLFEVAELETGRFRIRSRALPGVSTTHPDRLDQPVARAWLEVNGNVIPVTGPVTVLGRGDTVDVRIEDPGVSRRHAELRVHGELAELVDLDSTNGLVVEGQRIDHVELTDGTAVLLGSTTVVFRQKPR